MDANPQSAEGLKLGMLLRIPVVEGRNANTQQLQKANDYIYHIVEKGQSVFYIASKYNVDVESIYKNNVGTKEVLLEGAEIRIPKEIIEEKAQVVEHDNEKYSYLCGKTLRESLLFAAVI